MNDMDSILSEQIKLNEEFLQTPLEFVESFYLLAGLARNTLQLPLSIGKNIQKMMEMVK